MRKYLDAVVVQPYSTECSILHVFTQQARREAFTSFCVYSFEYSGHFCDTDINSYSNKIFVDIIMLSLRPSCNSFTGIPLILGLFLRSCLQPDYTAPNGSMTEKWKGFWRKRVRVIDVLSLNLSGGIVGKLHLMSRQGFEKWTSRTQI